MGRKEPNDYDVILGHSTARIKALLREAGIPYQEKVHSSHIFLTIGGYELQMMEKLIVEFDFTINQFRASFKDLRIEGPELSYRDLERGLLRAIDTSPRMFRRCIYMLYKFPRFRPSRETLVHLERCICNPDQVRSFLEKKGMLAQHFYSICERYHLENKVRFLLQ